jgi:hypothetical protein
MAISESLLHQVRRIERKAGQRVAPGQAHSL